MSPELLKTKWGKFGVKAASFQVLSSNQKQKKPAVGLIVNYFIKRQNSPFSERPATDVLLQHSTEHSQSAEYGGQVLTLLCEGGGHFILGGVDVTGGPSHAGAQRDEGLDQHLPRKKN